MNETDVVNEKRLFELKNEYIYRFYNFQETENYLIVKLLHKGQYLLGVYNKNDKQANIVTLDPYEGKYFFSFGNIIGFDEKTIYTTIDAAEIKRFWDGKDQYNNFEEKYPLQIDHLRKRFKTIREDGNPFLVMYTLN